MSRTHAWQHVRFVVQQVAYDLRHGLLFRPLVWTVTLGAAGLWLPWLDSHTAMRTTLPHWLQGGEAGTAQTQLATIASAMMTTLSVVYSVLVVALTLASVQFSPRLLGRFLGAASSQHTIGSFIGTFVYCLLVLRAVRSDGDGFVPVLSLTCALLLALLSLALLIYAIDGLARSIQANHIAADIAEETRIVIDQEMAAQATTDGPGPSLAVERPTDAVAVSSPVSGYLQLIAADELAQFAAQWSVAIDVVVRPGRFVIAGEPLAWVWPTTRWTDERAAAIRATFDLGSVRTLQQDAEFGLRQLVDMALKAISPAVNDPSTACTCIDHLTSLLCHAVQRHPLPPQVTVGPTTATSPHAAVWLPRVDSADLIDLAVQQLRQYGCADVAVCLRLARLLTAVDAVAHRAADRARLRHHARWLDSRSSQTIEASDRAELARRLAPLLTD